MVTAHEHSDSKEHNVKIPDIVKTLFGQRLIISKLTQR